MLAIGNLRQILVNLPYEVLQARLKLLDLSEKELIVLTTYRVKTL
jgi:hypothetical protein